MLTRSTSSMLTFSHPFAVGQCDGAFPPGVYEIVVEEELLLGLGFQAYRSTATYVLMHGKGNRVGKMTMHKTTQEDLEQAIARDRAQCDQIQISDAALSPQEDTT